MTGTHLGFRAASAGRAVARAWRSTGRRWLGAFALGLLGSVAGLLLFTTSRVEPPPLTTADVRTAVATALAKAAESPPRSTQVFRTILPSLVYIRTEGGDARGESSIGSGVIISDGGAILTAHHVVHGARRITVRFADGTESPAEIAGSYPNDLAVLRAVHGPELIVPAVLGGSGLRVGDEAFAVGNPLGLPGSLSAGVISGLDRVIPMREGGHELTGLIQFDAAVNPGSSGGPLLNREGQVVGIVTALANPANERSFTGIGFAVPLSGAGGGVGGPPR